MTRRFAYAADNGLPVDPIRFWCQKCRAPVARYEASYFYDIVGFGVVVYCHGAVQYLTVMREVFEAGADLPPHPVFESDFPESAPTPDPGPPPAPDWRTRQIRIIR